MKAADDKILSDQEYIDNLSEIENIIQLFEQGQLSHQETNHQLHRIYSLIRPYEHNKIMTLLSILQRPIIPFMNMLATDVNISPSTILKMTAQAVMVATHLTDHLHTFSPLILMPTDCAFLLQLLHYMTTLGTRVQLSGDSLAADLLTKFSTDILLPFIIEKVWTFQIESGKPKNLLPIKVDISRLCEFFLQQRILVLLKNNQSEEAHEILSQMDQTLDDAKLYAQSKNQNITDYVKSSQGKIRQEFKLHKTEFKKALQNILFFKKELHRQAIPAIRYHLWAKLALIQQPPQLTLALCYVNIAIDTFSKVKAITVPLDMYNTYIEIAAKHVGSHQYSSAVTVYETMLNRYPDVLKMIPSFRDDYDRMQKTLTLLKCKSYDQLAQKWHSLNYRQESPDLTIDFQDTQKRLTFTCDNIEWLLIFRSQLRAHKITHHLDKTKRIMTLSQPYELTSEKLFNVIYKSQTLHQHREQAFLKRSIYLKNRHSLIKQLEDITLNEVNAVNDCTDHAVTTYYNHNKTKRQKAPKIRSVTLIQPVISASKIPNEIITHNWGDDLPIYHPTMGVVYPIPNFDSMNTSLPKGIFFGYIDGEALVDLSSELLEQFEEQLARGKLVSKGDAQGIRTTGSELPSDSPYMFKINIHAQDIRLYGRVVADTTIDGHAKILIVFDQAIGHDQTLRNVPNNTPASLKK